MKKKLTLLLTFVIAFTLLTGCKKEDTSNNEPDATESATTTGEKDEAETTEPSEDKELYPLTVVLDWTPNNIHSFLFVAKEKGYFEEEGLDVTLQSPANSGDALTMTAAGTADLGLYYCKDVIMSHINEGIDTVAIAAVTQDAQRVMATTDKDINTIEDFRGKKIGYSGVESVKACILTALNSAGLSEDDVELINVGFNSLSYMYADEIDITGNFFNNHEVVQMGLDGYEVKSFSYTDYGVPRDYSEVFVTSKKQLDEKKEYYEAFLRACAKGYEDVKADPDAAIETLIANQGADNELDKEVESAGLKILIDQLYEKEDAKFLTMQDSVWEENMKWLLEQGLIKETCDVSEFEVPLYSAE